MNFLSSYRSWVKRCRDAAVGALSGCGYLQPQGGFYVTLPILRDEEEAAARLLQERNILVHPGYFYDIQPDHLVMTFIHEPDVVKSAFEQIAEMGDCRRGL